MPSFGKKTVRKVKWISALQWAYAFDAVESICNQFLIGNVQFVIPNYLIASTSALLRPVIFSINGISQFACFINRAVSSAFLYEPSAKPCCIPILRLSSLCTAISVS